MGWISVEEVVDMKAFTKSALFFVAGAAAFLLFAQARTLETEGRQTLLENQRVRVREVVLQPGVEYPEHRHELPHVGVIIRGGTLEFHEAGQVEKVDFKDGDVGWREAGVEHRIVNRSSQPVRVVEVELK